jgi:hypothetical protein
MSTSSHVGDNPCVLDHRAVVVNCGRERSDPPLCDAHEASRASPSLAPHESGNSSRQAGSDRSPSPGGLISIPPWGVASARPRYRPPVRVMDARPEGPAFDSPGQRPGFGLVFGSSPVGAEQTLFQAIKGRRTPLQGLVPALSFPGRCPGLSNDAPLGLRSRWPKSQ